MDQLKIKQRLIVLSNKQNSNYSSRISPLLDVIKPYSVLGLKIAVTEAFGETPSRAEFERCHLEASYLEQKIDILYATDKLKHYSSWDSQRSKTLRKIQIFYDISGLETTQDTINGKTHSYLWATEEPLSVIPTDLKLLREQKKAVVDFFGSLVTDQMDIWEWDEQNSEWFQPYTNNKRAQKMVTTRFAEIREDEPTVNQELNPDWAQVYDRHDRSIIFRFGIGCDLEAYESTVAKFCASPHQPYQ